MARADAKAPAGSWRKQANLGRQVPGAALTRRRQPAAGMALVGGRRPAGLMIDHEVGVTARTLKLPRFDSDHSDEDAS